MAWQIKISAYQRSRFIFDCLSLSTECALRKMFSRKDLNKCKTLAGQKYRGFCEYSSGGLFFMPCILPFHALLIYKFQIKWGISLMEWMSLMKKWIILNHSKLEYLHALLKSCILSCLMSHWIKHNSLTSLNSWKHWSISSENTDMDWLPPVHINVLQV